MDDHAWDARYGGAELIWGTDPNRFVAAELEDVPPGRALDLACGEGRNAIWLAKRGWRVVGVDFSAVGLDRAAQLATQAGADDRLVLHRVDVVAGPFPSGPFDVVVVAYLQLSAPQRRAALRNAAATLAAGGTLLVVGHDSTNLTAGIGGPQDPTVLFSPDDIVEDLADQPDLTVERAERVRRPVQTADGERHAIDALVRLRRARADGSE